MVAAGPTPTAAEMPLPNVPLIYRPGAFTDLRLRAKVVRLLKRLRLG